MTGYISLPGQGGNLACIFVSALHQTPMCKTTTPRDREYNYYIVIGFLHKDGKVPRQFKIRNFCCFILIVQLKCKQVFDFKLENSIIVVSDWQLY